jgi:hypothetical protein
MTELQEVEDRIYTAVLQLAHSAKALEACLSMSIDSVQAFLDSMASRRADLERTVSEAFEEARRQVHLADEEARAQWREYRKEKSIMATAHNSALESMVLDYRRRFRLRHARATPSDEDVL